MKPLVVLLTVFAIAFFSGKITGYHLSLTLSGNIAMSAMLILTASGHFAFTEGMIMMVPDIIPCRKFVVYASGVLEGLAAVGLLIPAVRHLTGWVLLAFFIFVLPVNIYAASSRVNYQNASFTGPGPSYLWFRVPLQVLFIAWIFFFSIHPY
ncbi:DoxX family protein [Flavitalea flava]